MFEEVITIGVGDLNLSTELLGDFTDDGRLAVGWASNDKRLGGNDTVVNRNLLVCSTSIRHSGVGKCRKNARRAVSGDGVKVTKLSLKPIQAHECLQTWWAVK